MQTITEHLREGLYRKAGLVNSEPASSMSVPQLSELRELCWSTEFEMLMRNRMIMGAFRYGPLRHQKKGGFDIIPSIHKRLAMYVETGNLEHLVDCANLCLIEFEKSVHPKKHFASIDDGHHTERKE
jgi:hypothetical protein